MSHPANTTTWNMDPSHSAIEFKIKHLMISNVTGSFKKFSGTVVTKGLDFSSAEIEVLVEVASLETGDDKRDGHLKSAEFFEVDKFKEIKFTAKSLHNVNSGIQYELTGDLTIKGISKKVKLNVEFGGIIKDPWGNEKAGFNVTGTVNRKDWDLTWNTSLEAGGVMLSDDVKIDCDVEFVKSKSHENSQKLEAKDSEEIAAE